MTKLRSCDSFDSIAATKIQKSENFYGGESDFLSKRNHLSSKTSKNYTFIISINNKIIEFHGMNEGPRHIQNQVSELLRSEAVDHLIIDDELSISGLNFDSTL